MVLYHAKNVKDQIKYRTWLGLFPFMTVVCLVVILYAGCGDKFETEDYGDLTLGVLLPMDRSSGPARENSLRTAIDEINSQGGVLGGKRIGLDIRSSEPVLGKDRETIAAEIANDLLVRHPNTLIGLVTSFSSTSRGVALNVSDPKHVPLISGSSTANANSGISPYFHRLAPRDDFQAVILARQAIEEFGITSVAIAIQEGDTFSEGLATVFQQKFQALRGTVTAMVHFTENDPDYVTKLVELYQHKPQAVLTAMLAIDVEFLTNVHDNITEIGMSLDELRFIMSDAQRTDNILEQAPKSLLIGDVDGNPRTFGTVSWPDITTLSFIHFQAQMKLRYNQDVESFTPQFYDIAYIYALAIERAHQSGADMTDLHAFREAVNSNIRKVSRPDAGDQTIGPENGWRNNREAALAGDVNYQGASGNCDIDEYGDVITNYDVFNIVEAADGSLVFKTIANVDPTEW